MFGVARVRYSPSGALAVAAVFAALLAPVATSTVGGTRPEGETQVAVFDERGPFGPDERWAVAIRQFQPARPLAVSRAPVKATIVEAVGPCWLLPLRLGIVRAPGRVSVGRLPSWLPPARAPPVDPTY